MDIFWKSIKKLENWVENSNYRGYEPFDGLSSFLKPLTFNNLFFERLLQQLIRQSPINLRPLFGIRAKDSTKGRGYMAWGYITLYKITAEKQYKKKAELCLEWLINNKAPDYKNFSWGNHFDFSSRDGKLPKFEPIIVWTSLIGQTFLDAYETFNNENFLNVALSICDWILDVPREKTNTGICLSYNAYKIESIHNSNMLGAAMLARAGKTTHNEEMLEVAKSAIEYSCSRQNADGSWYYGDDQKNHWIDNFHTGYNLDSLKCYIENTDDRDYDDNLNKGFKFFKDNFFEHNGRPKYYHNRAYPIDSQCASQAIETLANFSEHDDSSRELALKVANWTIENMQDKSGFFYYRQYPFIKAKTPMLHWAQATTYKALALLLTKLVSK